MGNNPHIIFEATEEIKAQARFLAKKENTSVASLLRRLIVEKFEAKGFSKVDLDTDQISK